MGFKPLQRPGADSRAALLIQAVASSLLYCVQELTPPGFLPLGTASQNTTFLLAGEQEGDELPGGWRARSLACGGKGPSALRRGERLLPPNTFPLPKNARSASLKR